METPETHNLAEFLKNDDSFPSTFVRTIGAIARYDGNLSPVEFVAVTDIAQQIATQTKAPNVIGALMFSVLEEGPRLSKALARLNKAARSRELTERDSLFHLAVPLLIAQGHNSRALARKLADSLNLKISDLDLESYHLPPGDRRGFVDEFFDRTRQLVKGKDLADIVDSFAKNYGEPSLSLQASAFRRGQLSRDELRSAFQQVAKHVEQEIDHYREIAAIAASAETSAEMLRNTADQLANQIQQRLEVVRAGIRMERDQLERDIADFLRDISNEIELILNRTDQWKDRAALTSVAEHQIRPNIEARLMPLIKKYEDMLRLKAEDLKLFQNDMRITYETIRTQADYSDVRNIMKLGIFTRVKNTIDSAATFTLGTSLVTVATAGAGVAAHVFGAAIALPVIVYAAPFVAVAGLIKWVSNQKGRKSSEMTRMRTDILDWANDMAAKIKEQFNARLDEIGQAFDTSAMNTLTPIRLNAEAAKELRGLKERLANQMVSRTQVMLQQITMALT